MAFEAMALRSALVEAVGAFCCCICQGKSESRQYCCLSHYFLFFLEEILMVLPEDFVEDFLPVEAWGL